MGGCSMLCDACHPQQKGYTIYFLEERQRIDSFINNIPKDYYQLINEDTIWLTEPAFFSFLDYAQVHLQEDNIDAAESEPNKPLIDKFPRKRLLEFTEERDASWIDEIILNNQITSYFQPIIQIKNNQPIIVGHELLSRGINTKGEIIPPNTLFNAARKRNRLFSLDRACRLQAVRNANIFKDEMIFINFIPTAIYNPEHCLSSTFSLVKELNINPENVVFEVVETDEIKDVTHLRSILTHYKKHGFKYALDDVGVGFNTIEKLEAIKPDIVKLAFEYSNGVSHDQNKQEMAYAVLQATKRLGSLALAEGVETEDDFHYLSKMGYDLFQGYYFSKPRNIPLTQRELDAYLICNTKK